MPLLYILAIFVTISFQLNDAVVKIHCETNQMGRMGDDEYCMFCANPAAADEDKHDCSKYYNLDNRKSHELVFHSEESGGCIFEHPAGIGVRIICQSVGNTYYYILAHGSILSHGAPDERWNFNSPLITFKCPGTTIPYEHAGNIMQLLERGKIEEALSSKDHEYHKGDKIHEYVFSWSVDLEIIGGIYQLKIDGKGKVKNIAKLYEPVGVMPEYPVRLFDAAETLDEKPGTILWLACSSFQKEPSHSGFDSPFTFMSELSPGPKTTAAVEHERKTLFDEIHDEYQKLCGSMADDLSQMTSKLEKAIGDKKNNPIYPKANEEYQWIKQEMQKLYELVDDYKQPTNYYNLGWLSQDLYKNHAKFFSTWKPAVIRSIAQLKSIKETVSAKQEYAASYYDYGGDIGYGIYDEYDSIDNGVSEYYQHILRKMKKQKKHHSHNHHDKYHSNH